MIIELGPNWEILRITMINDDKQRLWVWYPVALPEFFSQGRFLYGISKMVALEVLCGILFRRKPVVCWSTESTFFLTNLPSFGMILLDDTSTYARSNQVSCACADGQCHARHVSLILCDTASCKLHRNNIKDVHTTPSLIYVTST